MNYSFGYNSSAGYFSGNTTSSKYSNNENSNVWQDILSSDAKFNLYRINNNSQLRTLYMRRRTQLLRENATKHKENPDAAQIRKSYLQLRTEILDEKYGPVDQQSIHNQSQRTSKANSKAQSIDSMSLNYDWRENLCKKMYGNTASSSANLKYSSIYSSKESLTNTGGAAATATATTSALAQSVAANKNKSNSNLEESYSFAGVHHVFDNHKGAVTRVRFANNDKSLLATCSLDGSLVICQVIPSPATIIYKLEGHQSGIMDFQWSTTNDLIVTASLDGTSRVWQVTKGACMRILKDTCGAQVLCCCFQPLNENMIFTGNSKGLIQVYNLSTGIIVNKNCLQKVSGRVQCMCFDSSGTIVWIGDDKGFLTAFQFDIYTLKLNKTKKIINNSGYSITSISYRNWLCKDVTTPHLLVNAMPNYLLLYKLAVKDNSFRLRKRVCIKQSENSIRSTFCPIVSVRQQQQQQQKCLVCSGSEDSNVYIFDMENDEKPLINKLSGHSAPTLDVAFNFDQSLLASGDSQGTVFIWKTNNQS